MSWIGKPLLRMMAALAALACGACVSLEVAAPPVESLAAARAPAASPVLHHGRSLYVGKCARCHSVEPVKKYPLARWETKILPEMAEETPLRPDETAAVTAYVRAVWAQP